MLILELVWHFVVSLALLTKITLAPKHNLNPLNKYIKVQIIIKMSQITSKLTQKTTRLVQQQQMNKIFNKGSLKNKE